MESEGRHSLGGTVWSVLHCLGGKSRHDDTRLTSQESAAGLVILGVLPFFHTAGLVAQILATIGAGAKLVCLPTFEPRAFLAAIQKYKVNFLPLVPPLARFLNKSPLVAHYDISSVKMSGCGAAPLEPEQMRLTQKKMGLQRFTSSYGMTEATAVVTVHLNYRPTKTGSVGVLAANMDGKIIDPETHRVLGVGQAGELCVRGPNIMKGYFNNEQATKNAIDTDGFLHTGDVAYLDEDGYLFVVDRIKELIKYKAFQVAPAELEAVLNSHPDVLDVGVTGIPEEEAGEVPRAYVVKKPGSTARESDLQKFVEERVAPYKKLRGGLVFIDEIPRNQSGKVLRRRLKAAYTGHSKI